VHILGVAGWSGSGKTTLLTRLIPLLVGEGLRVAAIKHAHHSFDIDQPGKDSFQHRMAGAQEVMVSSANRWALMHENRGEAEASLGELIDRLSPADLVLVEGFKTERHDKLEVHRAANGKPLLCTGDDSVIALVTDLQAPEVAVPVLAMDDIGAVAEFVLRRYGYRGQAA
jgi:molybdopterin-guanine dinucleotide biosynthesis protein B